MTRGKASSGGGTRTECEYSGKNSTCPARTRKIGRKQAPATASSRRPASGTFGGGMPTPGPAADGRSHEVAPPPLLPPVRVRPLPHAVRASLSIGGVWIRHASAVRKRQAETATLRLAGTVCVSPGGTVCTAHHRTHGKKGNLPGDCYRHSCVAVLPDCVVCRIGVWIVVPADSQLGCTCCTQLA